MQYATMCHETNYKHYDPIISNSVMWQNLKRAGGGGYFFFTVSFNHDSFKTKTFSISLCPEIR